jgi:hypothetical protein
MELLSVSAFDVELGRVVAVGGEPYIVTEVERGFGRARVFGEPVREYYRRVLIDPHDPTRTLEQSYPEPATLREGD